jgi:hypothetical protein
LASLSELTPRKQKLYEFAWHKESALCVLKKKLKKLKILDSAFNLELVITLVVVVVVAVVTPARLMKTI